MRFAQVLLRIARAHHDPAVLLHPLQPERGLDGGVAVVRILRSRPLAEERIFFVEAQDGVAVLRFEEDAGEILFRLANLLAATPGEIDFLHVEAEVSADELGRYRLARTARAPRRATTRGVGAWLALDA